MFQFDKILYCTDLSQGSNECFKYAAFLAKKTGAEIHVLHVVEKLSSDARIALESYVMDSVQRAEMLGSRKRQAKAKLATKQEDFWAQVTDPEDLAVRKQIKSINIIESFPMEAILKNSREREVDLIVMGTHEKGFVETFLGSVARNVLARSRIPVLVVPLKERKR
ncbi:universal stress protein [Psychromonas sp. 14N.309.X.WAT.B.A12]|jgi:nucleotide-binding universal stress UspA family protein|uniref:universal stress protein n=1 Tax=unclassified Psychromonas TaxID=2614957 RepID=UPI0025B19211|nr:universal stress protein [Psychromonas sp. 14N.309.X.WAT.B.A12]MDN2663403.1 universal stress protein [Psychromonas sp. 14N.309.X.WAT.B.A12]